MSKARAPTRGFTLSTSPGIGGLLSIFICVATLVLRPARFTQVIVINIDEADTSAGKGGSMALTVKLSCCSAAKTLTSPGVIPAARRKFEMPDCPS